MAYPNPAMAIKGFYVEFVDGSTSRIFADSYSGRADLADFIGVCRADGTLTITNAAAVEWYILWDDTPARANFLIGGGTIVETATYRPRAYHYECTDAEYLADVLNNPPD